MKLPDYLDELEKLADDSMSQSYVSIEIGEMKALIAVVRATRLELDCNDTWDLCENNQDICPHCDKIKALSKLEEVINEQDN